MDHVEAFPLSWPYGWPRSRLRKSASYKVGYAQALNEMERELRLLKARKIIISSNVPVRGDGRPYADWSRRRIDDPGVAVYFERAGDPQVIACDTWDRVHHNIRAIGLTVAGLRAVQRAGASELLARAFTGFKALPAAGETTATTFAKWWMVLDTYEGAPPHEVRAQYRKLSRENHPDHGGDAGAMATINRAWEQAQVLFAEVESS